MNYIIAKHLLGKTRFTELILPLIQSRIGVFIGNGSADPDPDPYQNETDP